jgi:hypothetical protein
MNVGKFKLVTGERELTLNFFYSDSSSVFVAEETLFFEPEESNAFRFVTDKRAEVSAYSK